MLRLKLGDAVEVLEAMESDSVDALVTDPPAGISFMGKSWDGNHGHRDEWVRAFAGIFAECLRVMKPGAHGFVWALPRTAHWTTTALEDAGFEVRDVVVHLFGTGFPKSARPNRGPGFCQCGVSARSGEYTAPSQSPDDHNDMEADESGGAPRPAGAHRSMRTPSGSLVGYPSGRGSGGGHAPVGEVDDPASSPQRRGAPARNRSAVREDGLDAESGRSPSQARRTVRLSSQDSPHRVDQPLSSSERTPKNKSPSRISESSRHTQDTSQGLSYGTGLPQCSTCGKKNADGLGTALKPAAEHWILVRKPLVGTVAANVQQHGTGALNIDASRTVSGRWPPNVVLDQHAAAELDRQSGDRSSPWVGNKKGNTVGKKGGKMFGGEETAGVDKPEYADSGGASRFFPKFTYTAKPSKSEKGKDNHHPTVKPVALMKWLITLITPPGGTVLDPFMGSGTTGVAAVKLKHGFVGIEKDASYWSVARERIKTARAT